MNFMMYRYTWLIAVAQLLGVLRYKPEGRGFDSGWVHGVFELI
jgi:hypothetical protein